MRAVGVVLLAIVAVAHATSLPLGGGRSRVASLTNPGYGWVKGDVAAPDAKISFIVALKQRNLDLLEETFWAVSTPGNSRYQQFLSVEEVQQMVAPDVSVTNTVVAWLRGAGVENIISRGDSIVVETNAKAATMLFHAPFYVYEHSESHRQVVRVGGIATVPHDIAAHIDLIEGIANLPVPHLKVQRPRAPQDDVGIVPQVLQSMYKIPVEQSGSSASSSAGVIEFQGESYAPADLATYAQQVAQTITPLASQNIVGPNDPTNPQIEAELDIQFMGGVNDAPTLWFWLVDGDGWLYTFASTFSATASVPQVISISYAWSELDQCDISPTECQQLGVNSVGYVKRVNTEWQKIGARGISILTASGDSGTNGRTDPDCTTPKLFPDYPACSPYVTSVGATQINNPTGNIPTPPPACSGYQCPTGGDEVAVSFAVASFASGGGFSTVSPRPAYQNTVVSNYLKTMAHKLPPASYFNASNRGFPDVAAIGHNCLIYSGGIQPVGGTSCAAPIFASVIAALNTVVIGKTQKPLGFLNPFLYQMQASCSTCFQDITVGDNTCTEDGCNPSCKGFYCTTGWDPVTGLGSPNFQSMLAYVQSQF